MPPEPISGSGVRLTDQQRLAWLRLIRSENVGPITFRQLLNHFGSAAHATIPRVEQLSQMIGLLFRSALRSADVRQRAAARKGLAVKPLHLQRKGAER